LQRDNDLIELPNSIIDLQNILISWEDTAACIENLDLVITSCTSIAHLASAMGKPTWVIVPILPYHIWAYGDEHSPWYQETTKVFKQKTFGKWNEAFEKVENELEMIFPKEDI
jgi:ADP-heptose:LPS heptosyltransferase